MAKTTIDTPVGALVVQSDGEAITKVSWLEPDEFRANDTPDALCTRAAIELKAYFSGRLTEFTVPVRLHGSGLQQRVWEAMRAIPFGQVRTYGDVAKAVGSDPQPVGTACGQNPIPVIVPCHRIIGAGGKLTGFSGGNGIETKEFLLDLESGQGRLL
jgi:methylated-DNA-[protein]-cysteine S-methyltransferase